MDGVAVPPRDAKPGDMVATDDEDDARPGGLREENPEFARDVFEAEEALSFRDWFRDLGNMLKAFIGLNFMFVSFAFTKAGLVRGIVALLIILYLTEYCCHLLIKVKDLMPNANSRDTTITYGDVTHFVFGANAQRAVTFFLVLTQFGYCVGYLIFLSQTVHDLVHSTAPVWSFVLIPLPVLSILALLRSIRSLAIFSNVANFSLLLGFISVSTYIGIHFRWNPPSPPLSSLPLFFGQMTAALEGIALVLPIQMSMKQKSQFPLILRTALVIMGSVLLVVGVLGMVTFGDETRSIILLNMQGSAIVVVVKVILCLGILFTYPLQLVPVLQALEGWLQGKSVADSHIVAHEIGGAAFEDRDEANLDMEDEWKQSPGGIISRSPRDDTPLRSGALDSDEIDFTQPPPRKRTFVRDWRSISGRLMIVLATALTAILAGKSFGMFQALVGSLGAASLAYTIPPLLYIHKFRRDMSPGGVAFNWFIVGFGVVGAVVGTATSIYEMSQPGGGEGAG